MVKVVHEAIGIRHGQITTIHDPTNTNVVVDAPHKDLRRARSAMLSLQPTTTGSATAIALIYPELKGKLNGHAVRVPVLNASLTDCVFEMERPTTADEVNELFRAAAAGPLAGILGFEARPLVSADYANDTRSAIVDGPSTHGDRRDAAQGLCLVRQRGRLCLPHGRSRQHRHRAGCLMTGVRNYAIVTASYWGFTLTDGALRMLVLLHFYSARLHAVHARVPVPALRGRRDLRQSRRRLARHALRHPAHAGGRARRCRSAACCCSRRSIPAWSAALSVAWVVAAQGISGVAKDLTKTASKSAIKATSEGGAGPAVPLGRLVHRLQERDEGRRLLRRRPAAGNPRLPAGACGSWPACSRSMLVGVALSLPRDARQGEGIEIASANCSPRPARINLLAAARIFLFGARDVWFVVGLPVFLYARAGASWKWPAFSPPGRSATAWCRRIAPSVIRRSADGLVARGAGSAALGRGADRDPARARAPAAATPDRRARPIS